MNLLLQLICRDAWHHRSRIALAVLATTAMSAMIVWIIGSLDLMMLKFDEDAENYLGQFHLALVPEKNQPFPQNVIDELRNDNFVMQVVPALQIRNTMGKMRDANDVDAALRRARSLTGLPTQSPAVVGIDVNESPFVLQEGRWFGIEPQTMEGVIGTAAAQNVQDWGGVKTDPVQVGDSVICRVGTQDFKINIVGLIEQNLASGSRTIDPAVGAVYVSLQTAKQIKGNDQFDYIYVQLREGTDTNRFCETWNEHLSKQNITMNFHDVESIQHRLNQTRSRNSTAGLLGGPTTLNSIILFSTLVSVLIVFTALSMGITERTRTFAMLRIIGMQRRKLAALVFGESLILCFFGWLGGMLAGWGVLQLSVSLQPNIFGGGKTVSLGLTSIGIAGLSALTGSFLAAFLPAYRVTRISPLVGMNRGYAKVIHSCWFWFAGFIGIGLLFVNPLIIYTDWFAEFNVQSAQHRQFLYSYIGLPTQIFGCLLLVPGVILLIERFVVPMIAPLFCLPKELLMLQLSSNLWRTLGTTLALCIGLGVYAFLEISGYSMLVPYIQSRAQPEIIATFLPTGVPRDEVDTVRSLPGIDSNRFLTLAVDQSFFSPQQTERFLDNGMIKMQTSAVVFGIDVEAALGKHGNNKPQRKPQRKPLLDYPFVSGTLEDALQKMRTGKRYCLVPDSFAHRADVHVGDKLELVLPHDKRIVEYEICGIVSIHGWLWMNKISGVRTRGYRSGAMLLAPFDVVKQDYQIDDASFFWFDRLHDTLGNPMVSDTELEHSLQQLAERFAPNNDGVSRPMVKVSSREYLTGTVGMRSDEVIQAAAKMPLILLVISSFGMMGTIAASVRSRRFEFGVLRSLGITRFGLMRLILAEALLIALAVITISMGFGIIGAWCFIGLMKYVAGFGGFTSPLTLPVYWLALGFAIALIFCLLAALCPAIIAGRTPPTKLLREA